MARRDHAYVGAVRTDDGASWRGHCKCKWSQDGFPSKVSAMAAVEQHIANHYAPTEMNAELWFDLDHSHGWQGPT